MAVMQLLFVPLLAINLPQPAGSQLFAQLFGSGGDGDSLQPAVATTHGCRCLDVTTDHTDGGMLFRGCGNEDWCDVEAGCQNALERTATYHGWDHCEPTAAPVRRQRNEALPPPRIAPVAARRRMQQAAVPRPGADEPLPPLWRRAADRLLASLRAVGARPLGLPGSALLIMGACARPTATRLDHRMPRWWRRCAQLGLSTGTSTNYTITTQRPAIAVIYCGTQFWPSALRHPSTV